jgi:predicted O-methyltransferase YrrM
MSDYLFSRFELTDSYKQELIEFVRRQSNIEIGGYRLYDGMGNHYMQNAHEITDLIFALKSLEQDRGIKFERFLEIGFAAGINNTFLNKVFEFKKIVAIDYVAQCGISTEAFFANLRFKNLTMICGDSTAESSIENATALGPYDLIFIDGGHTYDCVKKDFHNYSKCLSEHGVIAFHDVCSDSCPGVPKFWHELQESHGAEYEFREFYDANQRFKYGIGLMYPKK